MNKINKIVCLSKSSLHSRAGKRIVLTSLSYLLNSGVELTVIATIILVGKSCEHDPV